MQNLLVVLVTLHLTPVTQFSEVRNKTIAEARQKQNRKEKVSDAKFITTYNPA